MPENYKIIKHAQKND